MRSLRLRTVVVFAVSALLFACPAQIETADAGDGTGEAQCAADSNKPSLPAGAVYFGTRDPSHVILDPAQKRAVVGVGEGQPPGAVCSGALITDDIVLTASHCTEGQASSNFYVTFGVDDYDPELVVDVVEKTEHPDLDIAMLRLAFAPATQLDVRPIPAFGGVLSDTDIGEIFEMAGFGETESGESNGLFFTAEPFAGFEEGGYLVVDGEGRHGVCFGDSGGPSLRQTVEGGVRVMGVLSYGDPECTGFDRYTRVDLARVWLEDFAGTIPGTGPVPCGAATSTGRCSADGRVAEFCNDSSELVRDPCVLGEICGTNSSGKRCISIADNPCGAITTFGQCDDAVLSWCDNDIVKVRDCARCGAQVCAPIDNLVGFGCVNDACGGVTFTGECKGNVAHWCEDNQQQTLDCAADGQVCGFVDAETGFFCQ